MLDRFFGPLISSATNKFYAALSSAGIDFQKYIISAVVTAGTGCFLAGMQLYYVGLIFLLISRIACAGAVLDAATSKRFFTTAVIDILTLSAFAFFFALGQMQSSTAAAFLILSLGVVGLARAGQIFLNVSQRHFTGQAETLLFLFACCLYPQGFAAIAALFGILWLVGGILQIAIIARQS